MSTPLRFVEIAQLFVRPRRVTSPGSFRIAGGAAVRDNVGSRGCSYDFLHPIFTRPAGTERSHEPPSRACVVAWSGAVHTEHPHLGVLTRSLHLQWHVQLPVRPSRY